MGPLKRVLILDTSAVLSGVPPPPDARLVTSPAIENELQPGGPTGRAFENLRAKGLEIQAPGPAARAKAKAAAEATGDVARLSAADLELVALALEWAPEGGLLLTDDYSVQNVAMRLGVPFQPIAQRGIQEEFQWRLRCTGCGRWFEEAPKSKECPICGSKLRSKRKPNDPPPGKRGSAPKPRS